MLETNTVVPSCKFAAATAAAVAACDGLDGVKDGVLENPRACTFDPKALVGHDAGDCGAITEADAQVIRAIWEGPRRRDGSFLWHGLERGADFSGLSGTGGTPLAPRPNGITLDWWRYFLNEDPQWNWTEPHARRPTSGTGISQSNSSARSSPPTIPISPRSRPAAARSSCGTGGPTS